MGDATAGSAALAEQVRAGDRRAVARALTLLERGAAEGRTVADLLFGSSGRAVTVGITGPPGVGKSTLVDAVTASLRSRQATVAVLAVDPSSPWSHGALLGDRIRMRRHATDPGVFIRSVSSRGRLGGLADVALSSVRLLDAAGFDVVIVETVGIGQAEIDIARLADCVVLVTMPGAGDQIQAAKSGVMEVADVLVVNRADDRRAYNTVSELQGVLQLRRGAGAPPVLATTATTGAGADELVDVIDRWTRDRVASGELESRRVEALVAETRALVTSLAADRVLGGLDAPLPGPLRQALADRRRSPGQAARQLLSERFTALRCHPTPMEDDR